MRITFATKRNETIVIDFGYHTEFHDSMNWFTITKEYYNYKQEIEYAEHIFSCFRHPKFRKI